jgi:HD-GYP domain-containing protein (c-di-GMP phosphodiesterase class II)
MKIKQLTLSGILLAVFIFITAFYVNFDLVPNVRKYTEQNQSIVENLTEHKIRLDLPLTQWLDVQNGLSHRPLAPIENEAVALISGMRNQVQLFKNSLAEMNRISVYRHQATIDIFQLELNQLESDLDFLILRIRDTNLTGTQQSREIISDRIENLRIRYAALNQVIVMDLSVVLNTMIGLMMGILLILMFGLIRFVYFQIPYMVTGLTRLADRNYTATLKKPLPFFIEEQNIHRYIDDVFDENRFIDDVREVLLNQYIVEDAMDQLFPILKARMGIDRIGLAFIDYPRQVIKAEYGVIDQGSLVLGPGFEVPFDATSLSVLMRQREASITSDFIEELAKRPQSAALKLLATEGMRSNLILPMTMGNAVFGFLFLSSRQLDFFTEAHKHLGEKIVYEIKGLLNRSYFTKIVFSKITTGFSELVDKKDNETGAHIQRMTQYSVLLAKKVLELNHPDYPITERTILEIERNAAVHDIGKVGIPDAILKKPGQLTDDEWEIMRTHPMIGGDIFKSIRDGLSAFDPELYKIAEEITRYHHEKWNGKGYPYGLSGHDIPLVARIVTVADVFDAISSKRVYKDAFTIEDTFDTLMTMRGETLDPFLVDLFIQHKDDVLHIYNAHNE